MYNQYLLAELIKAQVKAEQQTKKQTEQKQEEKTVPVPPDSFSSDPGRISLLDEPIPSSNTLRTPLFIRGGILVGLLSATVMGVAYLFNFAYNGNQANVLPHKGVQYRKVDDVYAHTILTQGDAQHGKDFVQLDRNTWNSSRTYIGYNGCSSVDEIITRYGFLGTGEPLHYQRSKDGELKKEMFVQADVELQEQCHRFKQLIESYFPNRLSR